MSFEFCRYITHVGHDDLGPPLPSPSAVIQAGYEQSAIIVIGWRNPTHQRYQQYPSRVLTPPQSQRMFLIAHIPPALAGFKGALPHAGAMGCISLGFFFLKPSQAASKSVASMSATAFFQPEACPIKLVRSWSLIWRSPPTPTSVRNSCSIRALGIRSRWARRAKARQARCSLNKVSTSLRRWAGVSTVNKCVRHNWAALK